MTKTCFNLRYFNLPQTALDVLRRVANPNGEICGGEETDIYLSYSGPFADLSMDDYLKLQSDFLSKGLIQRLHSPDQLRFVREGLADYIKDPQKRRAFAETLDANSPDERGITIDSVQCVWEKSFVFPTLRSDDTLIQAVNDYRHYGRSYNDECNDVSKAMWKSFAHYYGLSEQQMEVFVPAEGVTKDWRDWYDAAYLTLDALMRDGRRTPAEATHLVSKNDLIKRYGFIPRLIRESLFSLSKYGISDATLIPFHNVICGRMVGAYIPPLRSLFADSHYLEPLFLELYRLGVSDPIATLKGFDNIEDLFRALTAMRDHGYSDDEMRWVVTYYSQIAVPRILGRSVLEGFADIFPRARKEGVSFKEIRWILEDAAGNNLNKYFDVRILDIFRAYCHQPHRTREAVYGLYQDYPRTMALALEPSDAEAFQDRITIKRDYGVINDIHDTFAKRLGIERDAAGSVLGSGSQLLWEFVFKHRTEACIFDPQKMEEYKAIAKDLHNRGTDAGIFFSNVSFDYALPPKSVQEAAQMLSHLQAIDTRVNGWGLAYLAKAVVPHWPQLQKNYRAWQNPKTGRLDVTRHNIKQVNQLLALFAPFPFYKGQEGPSSEHLSIATEGKWIARHLDVEEIDARHLSVELYADYFELIKRLQDLNATAAGRYLSKQMLDLEAKKIFTGDKLDIAKIEEVRRRSNESYPHLGDRLVDNLGIAMLEELGSSVVAITPLRRIARAWGLADNPDVARDARGLYQHYSYFAYQMISDVVMDKTDNWRDTDRIQNLKTFLAEQQIDLEALVDELEAAGFPIRTESDWDKFINRMTSDPGYVWRRAAQKTLPEALLATNMSGLKVKPATDWAVRQGITVQVIANEKGTEIVRAIQCDRSVVGVELLINNDAHVDTEARKKELGAKYVFSAPLNMTTPDTRTMTEIAYDRGEPMNWLMSVRGKDGLLLVDPSHSPKILDKRAIALHQMLDAADVQKKEMADALDVWRRRRKLPEMPVDKMLSQVIQPFTRLSDKLLFRMIMAQKSYSVLSGMLFTSDSDSYRLKTEKGTASRRLFVEYADGKFGVVDGTEYLTTQETFEAAKAAGATKAIYMDTGMWDQADYVDGKGDVHRLDQGLSNSSASTNRVIIRVR